MFYGLSSGTVRIRDFEIVHFLEDIQSLNERALKGELDVTAISAHSYPYVSNHYWILSCGASMGKGYGPILVCRGGSALGGSPSPEDFAGKRIAVPGKMTTAYLLSRIYLADFEPVEISFDQISDAVKNKKVDAGLLIHEGQLTYKDFGLLKVMDFGERWLAETSLPLPLGLDVVRSDLGNPLALEIRNGLRESIQYAFDHEAEALAYARKFGRGIEEKEAKKFVRMYVNEYTLEMGEEGKQALTQLFQRAYAMELIPNVPTLKII